MHAIFMILCGKLAEINIICDIQFGLHNIVNLTLAMKHLITVILSPAYCINILYQN